MLRWPWIFAWLMAAWLSPFVAATAVGNEPGGVSRGDAIALANWLDRRLEVQCAAAGIQVPSVVDDGTYLRRAYLDLLGTIPSVSEFRDFLADPSATKRHKLIDRLVGAPQSPAHLARVWRRILVPENEAVAATVAPLETWLQAQFSRNLPYDALTRQLATAGGASPARDAAADPAEDVQSAAPAPVSYLLATGGQPATMASSVSRIFLGIRLSCAQCHDHPFADWSQEDFWGLAAFFAGSHLRQQPATVGADQERAPLVDSRTTQITPVAGGPSYPLRFLWGEGIAATVPDDKLPRQVFSEWLTSVDNPHFAATAVNRVWQYLCGRGLTDSVDHLDQASPEERELLDDLAALFALNGFDTRWLIQGICTSKYYQRPSTTSEKAGFSLSHRPLKVLDPEQLYHALETALAFPISRVDQGPRYNGERDQLVARMSEALGDKPEDFRNGIPQALMLMNGRLTAEATDLNRSRTLRGIVDALFLQPTSKIETLFMATLSRRPEPDELNEFLGYVESESRKRAYSQILWALINSPEFVLSR